MSREEARKMYEGKFFYEVIKTGKEGLVLLNGPRDDIYYAAPVETEKESEYKFLQVIDGRPVQAFKENEILVTMRRL